MMSRGPLFSALALAAAAVTLAGCGGGGGSGPAPDPLQLEYDRQGGLHLIKANAMHQRGGTGQGVTVAVFDSGSSDQPEMSGKYIYESKVDIDCSTVPPGETCEPREPDAVDDDGHGTFVASLIAAPKDEEGILGVAYEARIASVKIHSSNLTDGQYPSWLEGLIPQIDKMTELGAHVTNNSWGTPVKDVELGPSTTQEVYRTLMPVDTYQAYVDAGGVQVWSTGNEQAAFPQIEAAAPSRFPDLEKGWLAVGAIALDGMSVAWYSNWCGVAADWCIVAPGGDGWGQQEQHPDYEGITSLDLNGEYATWTGTSFAAPMVSAAIAALKSMFPNLTYHQIRDRILETADEGVYAGYPVLPGHIDHPRRIYGHGLLDLDAASSPVGETSLPMSGSAWGPAVPTRSTGANLPPAAVNRYLAGRSILALDAFQRAPFLIPADAFAVRRGPQLALGDLHLGMEARDGAHAAGQAAIAFGEMPARNSAGPRGRARGVLGFGARVMEELAGFTGVSGPDDGLYRMTEDALGLSVRFASGAGGQVFAGFAANVTPERAAAPAFGTAGWAPRAVASLRYVPQGARNSFELSAAPQLKRPMGWDGAGAFAVSGDAYGVSWHREITSEGGYQVGFAGRLARLETEAGPLVRFDDATIAAAALSLSLPLGEQAVLEAGLGMERAVKPVAGRLRLPRTIDGSGTIGFDEVRLNGADFLNLDRGMLRLHYTPTDGVALSTGLAVVRDGFGDGHAITGMQAEIAF